MAPLFHSGTPDYPLPTSWKFQWSYGGDGEPVKQVLSARREHVTVSHVYQRFSWETSAVFPTRCCGCSRSTVKHHVLYRVVSLSEHSGQCGLFKQFLAPAAGLENS